VNGIAVLATPGFMDSGILPVIQFDNSTIEVNEADGVISLDIYIAAANGEQSTVAISYLGGTATLGDDHDLGDLPSINLPANTDGVEQLTFPLYEDALDEGAEIFTIGLTAVSNAATGINSTIDVIITDNDHETPTLYINELMSVNQSTLSDEFGEFEDWIEIYNPNAFDVDIGGYYLSDDETDETKSRLPVGTALTVIPAGGWRVLFADQQLTQGTTTPHLDFKLNSTGEAVIFTSQDGETEIDSKAFGIIPIDVSFGRNGDGAAGWVNFTTSTPGASNQPLSLVEATYALGLYPNPTTAVITLTHAMSVTLTDLSGRIVMQLDNTQQVDLSSLPSAVYILRSADGGVARVVKE